MANEATPFPKQIDLFYDKNDSDASARNLVYQVRPHWKTDPGLLEIKRFTEGTMNILLKITKQSPGRSNVDNDKESVLLRAYGKGSDVVISRDAEARTHMLLAARELAPPLLARFNNGLLYRFLPGRVCTPQDLCKEPVWRAVARRLGEWHARLPLPSHDVEGVVQSQPGATNPPAATSTNTTSSPRTIWTILQEWTNNIPTKSLEAKTRKIVLQRALEKSFSELVQDGHEDHSNYVLGHCDLLSSNIILAPEGPSLGHNDEPDSKVLTSRIHFIDYEYAIACPAAFDLANHFSEWGGYECDYNMLPTQTTRQRFIEEYLQSYKSHPLNAAEGSPSVEQLCHEVDKYRGMPGLCWGIQALIQDEISDVEFDHLSYAMLRLAEFWAWRREVEGIRAQEGEQIPLRERRWAQEA